MVQSEALVMAKMQRFLKHHLMGWIEWVILCQIKQETGKQLLLSLRFTFPQSFFFFNGVFGTKHQDLENISANFS